MKTYRNYCRRVTQVLLPKEQLNSKNNWFYNKIVKGQRVWKTLHMKYKDNYTERQQIGNKKINSGEEIQ